MAVLTITPGGVVSTLAGSGNPGFADGAGVAAMFNYPMSIAVDSSGNVYVADRDNNRIRKITPAGFVSTLAGSGSYGFSDGPGSVARFSSPQGVDVESSGFVYVADSGNHRIRKITPAGVVITLAGTDTGGFADGAAGVALLATPADVAVDSAGIVYFADVGCQRIRKIVQY